MFNTYSNISGPGGHALDIFLHGPESAHKNGIIKKNIRSHIHSHTPKHTPKNREKTFNSRNMMPSFTCPLPVECGRGRLPGSLEDYHQDCSTSEDFSPRTVLTENICRCVQQIFQHRPAIMPFLKISIIPLSCLASVAPQADSW